jgi:hypothetical protein
MTDFWDNAAENNDKIVIYIDLFCMITTNNVAYTTAGFTSRQKRVNTIIGCPKLVLFKWSSKFRDDNWTTDWLTPVNSMSFIWNDNMREKREANANAT